jgi:hypothetical protein
MDYQAWLTLREYMSQTTKYVDAYFAYRFRHARELTRNKRTRDRSEDIDEDGDRKNKSNKPSKATNKEGGVKKP